MKKHLSRLLSLILSLLLLTTTAAAVTVQIRYLPCDFTYNGNSGTYINISISSGRPRNDLSILSAYDADGNALESFQRDTVYSSAAGASISEITVRKDGVSADSAEFIPCTATLAANGYGLQIRESGKTVTLRAGDTIASALTDGCNLLLYRNQIDSRFEFRVILYPEDGANASTTTTPGSTATNPGSTTTNPGSTTTNPGSTTTNPGSTTTNPGSTTTNPGSTTTNPGSTTTNPGSTTTNPGSTTTNPGSTTTNPGSTTTNPGSTTTTTTGGKLVTGSVDLPQLSKQEIISLLSENSLTLPNQIFDVQPSCSSPYQTGKLSSAALQAALNRLNALRRIAGMPAASLDQSWCDSAQYGAVILGQLGTLSHQPAKPAGMDKSFYDAAYDATYSSNLGAGRTLTAAVDGLMDDSTAGNITSVGHRRWQLSPALTKVGFGYVDNGSNYRTFTVEKVFDRSAMSSQHSVNYDSFGWPSAGYFPNDLTAFTKNTPWTVCLNPSLYAAPSGITVRISGGGRTWTLSGSYEATDTGAYLSVIPADSYNYGNNHCITFRPDGVTGYEGVYTVEILGLRNKSNTPVPFSYTVEFFSTAQSGTPSTNNTNTTTNPNTTNSNTNTNTSTNNTTNTTGSDNTTKPDTSGSTRPQQTTQEPSTSNNIPNLFTDVPSGAYYTDAVLWALNTGVTAGTTATTFEPYTTCTRGQVVTFLWRAKGSPEPATRNNPFRDVSSASPYYKAILWAAETGITTGTSSSTFSPNDTCTNGHVVTFLWRAEGKPAASGTSSLASSFRNDFYTDAVAWADSAGLLANTGAAFDPASQSPRANIVTYLYRDLAE